MSDNKNDRAAEIENAINESDAKKRADSDKPADDGKLDQILNGLGALTERVDSVCTRMDTIEGNGKKTKADENMTSEGDPMMVAADSNASARALFAGAQARCDSVAQRFGESAPRFMLGELLGDYRRRMVRQYQRYSKDFAKVDLDKINDPVSFDAIEAKIYADASISSFSPEVPFGQLLARERRDKSGRTITEFFGEPRAWMNQFAGHRRSVTGFTTKFPE